MPIPAGDKLWELRWNEVAALDRSSTLIIQPTGAIEQHGHHLPIDTDIFNSTNIALRAAAAVNACASAVQPVVSSFG